MKKKKSSAFIIARHEHHFASLLFNLLFLLEKEPQLADFIFRNPHNLEGFLYKLGIGWHEPLSSHDPTIRPNRIATKT